MDALPAVSKKADYPAICQYADLTNDYNPIHVDRDFAAASPMKGLIAHGTMSMNLIWQSLRQAFGNEGVARTVLDVRFVRPVREDDLVTSGGRPAEGGENVYEVWIRNQNDEPVIQGTATIRPA